MTVLLRRSMTALILLIGALVLPTTTANAAAPGVVGSLDSVIWDGSAYRLTGWALNTATPSAVVEVHVYLRSPTGTVGRVGFRADQSRPDVAAALRVNAEHGFVITLPDTGTTQNVCVYGIDARTGGANALLGCRNTSIEHDPRGTVDSVQQSGFATTTAVTINGWAYDPDAPRDQTTIHLYDSMIAPDTRKTAIPLSTEVHRPDVAAAFPGVGANQGFSVTYTLQPWAGPHRLCLYVLNTGAGSNTLLGCQTVVVGSAMIGAVDSLEVTGIGTVAARGWTINQLNPAELSWVALSSPARPANIGSFESRLPRPDVATVFPSAGAAHGFDFYDNFDPGSHRVCVLGFPRSANVFPTTWEPYTWPRELACRELVVPNATGVVDSVTVSDDTVIVRGWAFDPIQKSSQINLKGLLKPNWIGAEQGSRVTVTTDLDRPDVNAAFGLTGRHGFEITMDVSALAAGPYLLAVQSTEFWQDFYYQFALTSVTLI